jgi:antitoxin component YwqK of YwqJK toxin-antitoxin module
MSRSAYRSSIPPQAVEIIEERHPNGTKQSASYVIGGEKVGRREWDEDGRLLVEEPVRGDVWHGNVAHFYPGGHLEEVQPYRQGRMHGTGKQWSEDGRLLVTWKLSHGTGLDLWCDSGTGTLAEEHYWPEEGELGYQRQWNADEQTICEEYSYVLGKGYHGIWREWNERGRLQRGFPDFYVNDRKVTRRQYLKACQADPTLPPYRPEDDDPHRELPAEYLAQRKKTQR